MKFFYVNGDNIYKHIEYNKQGSIIKDTIYNNYNICWKEALVIAKHKAKRNRTF
ncbi:hypothetical protein [Flavivirga aquatica]|uniref:hypothetical protein n=1 Tax=Flavivirga aquatica TaxID=1849968 RepID=UPI0013F4BF64|nr:hypothetical protein [Flavivirga aquatica]